MRRQSVPFLVLGGLVGLSFVAVARSSPDAPDYPIRAISPSAVKIDDAFWARKIEVNRTVSIQHVFARSEENGGTAPAQLIEAAAWMLADRKDPELEAHVDRVIQRFASAIDTRNANPENAVRTNGTFLEAAVAYYEATGKRSALDAAIKAANAMDAAYGPGKKTYISGHEASRSASSPSIARRATRATAIWRSSFSTSAAATTTHARANTPSTGPTRRTTRTSSIRPRPSAMPCARRTSTFRSPTSRR